MKIQEKKVQQCINDEFCGPGACGLGKHRNAGGSRCLGLFLQLQIRIPTLEHGLPEEWVKPHKGSFAPPVRNFTLRRWCPVPEAWWGGSAAPGGPFFPRL